MSNRFMNAAKRVQVGNPTGKAVLLCIADLAGDDGVCRYSIDYLAEVLELGPSTARKWLTKLEASGLIVKERIRKGDAGWSKNSYRLAIDPAQGTLAIALRGSRKVLRRSKKPLPGSANLLPRSADLLPDSKIALPGSSATSERLYTCIKEDITFGDKDKSGPQKSLNGNKKPEAWAAVCRILEKRLHKEAYGAWFPQVSCAGFDDAGDTVTVTLRSNETVRDWITAYYSEHLDAALAEVTGSADCRIDWQLEASAGVVQ